MGIKIIFLDIIGVIQTDNYIIRTHEASGSKKEGAEKIKIFDKAVLKNLLDIINKTNAYIVITSDWKLTEKEFKRWQATGEFDRNIDNTWEVIINNFKPLGLTNRIIGVTPFLVYPSGKDAERGKEIGRWLEDNNHLSIESIVIIDDDNDMEELTPYLVKCNSYYGLTKNITKKVIDMLNQPFNKEYKVRSKKNKSKINTK